MEKVEGETIVLRKRITEMLIRFNALDDSQILNTDKYEQSLLRAKAVRRLKAGIIPVAVISGARKLIYKLASESVRGQCPGRS